MRKYSSKHLPMGVRIGLFDPIQLIFNVMNALIVKKILSIDEARIVIKQSLPPEMPDQEKENLLNSLIKKQ